LSAEHRQLLTVRQYGLMQNDVDDLVDLLDLEAIEVNIFRGVSPQENRQRIFGGQVAGQALVAAARTVDEDRPVHSLHAYFLRPGDPTVPVLYEVDRIRDGRSFTTRRVVGIQHGRPIFNLAASFHIREKGLEHLEPMPDVPAADDLPNRAERFADMGMEDPFKDQPHPLDMRYITTSPLRRTEPLPPVQQVWFRADGKLPDNQVLHTCLLTYASDMTLLDTTLLPHGTGAIDQTIQMASLDHAMWFHGEFRADEWLLYDQHTPASTGARGLATGRVFTHDGRLIASVMQEGLIRKVDT
jgi:acyl-CoA thioesterase-2